MSGLLDRVAAYSRLGIASLARVGLYRLGVRSGLHPVLSIADMPVSGPFFAPPQSRADEGLERPSRWTETQPAFFAHDFPLEDPPHWNTSPFEPEVSLDSEAPWHALGDFDSGVADIKSVWEASRWDWVPAMAQRAALGETSEVDRLNRWLADWQRACAPYHGPNWKCGQEASVRVMQLAVASLVLRQEMTPAPALLALVRQHCRRIAPTMGYARGQDNNHGTSEAAALFIGGSWLASQGAENGSRWAAIGRRTLEERCLALVERDGTFSQYSVTYHRILLETVCLAETWRRRLDLAPFSEALLSRLGEATRWMRQFTDPVSGDAPNIGANDGAMFFPLADTPYRDFRPIVQWSSALFSRERAFPLEGKWDQILRWLDITQPDRLAEPLQSVTLDDGGFHILRAGDWKAYLRYPRFRFRPSQADALHCDVWLGGRNLVRDAGTFSYSATEGAVFATSAYHSTVEFDGRDQMPKVSRFLYGGWLQTSERECVRHDSSGAHASAAYCDSRGSRHARALDLDANGLTCTDRVGGEFTVAILRWRLEPGSWLLEGNRVTGNGIVVEWSAAGCDSTAHLVMGRESRHYLQATDLPVLEIAVTGPCTIVTRISRT